jgi:hypothetical protein
VRYPRHTIELGESQNNERLDYHPTRGGIIIRPKGWLKSRPRVGDVVRLRKAHPCGSYEWEVVRVGADIGLKCLKCQHRVLLERGVFERRLKEFVSRSD